MNVSLRVNGESYTLDVAPNTLLVSVLREHLGLTGTHVGCDTSQCGACTIHVDGRAVKSCAILAVQVQDAEVLTIEGLGSVDELHPMQQAFRDCHGLQCGFCTPGMIMQAVDLVSQAETLMLMRYARVWKGICAAVRATRISSLRLPRVRQR